jgi:hypothetical protein
MGRARFAIGKPGHPLQPATAAQFGALASA